MTIEKTKRELEVELNQGLKGTFPASDPVSPNRTDGTPDRPLDRRPAKVDKTAVNELAKQVPKKK